VVVGVKLHVGHREAFGVSEKEHVQIQSEVESVILDSVTNFNAVIKVKSQYNIVILSSCHMLLILVVSVHNLRLKEEG